MTIEHVARYAQLSHWRPQVGLCLSCAQDQMEAPSFFQGRLTSPRRTADFLLALSRVVASRFHVPAALLARILREADPVITCATQRMRWEGFSACCSAYARLDLLPQALDGALLAQGTTNVDLGPQAREALSQLNDSTDCKVFVGPQCLELVSGASQVVERKVPLPLRWLKGFVESQAYQAHMRLRWEISAVEARKFLQGLPKGPSKSAATVVSAGRGLRLSQVASPQGMRLAGWQRLAVLQDLLRHSQSLRVYSHEGGASAWELCTPDSHFHLVLSPEVWRGFSGEGQVLSDLIQPDSFDQTCQRVRQSLDWSPLLSLEALSQRAGLGQPEIRRALARLASQGVVGFDLAMGGYFQRLLPYHYDQVEALHPRLKAARKLRVSWQDEVAWVESGDTTYRVAWEGSHALCNCPWFAKEGNQRGPCKHILAAHLDLEAQ